MVKIAIAHAAPVFLDLAATLDKTCSLAREAAGHGARLIVFPESYIPAFPVWCALRAPICNHDLFCRFAANSMLVPGPELAQLCAVARDCNLLLSVGINERGVQSSGCLYNSNVLIGPDGSLLNHHRKIMPTFFEKLVWAPGDGAGLRVCETACGRVGMLICGENTNPLARFTLIAQDEQIHLSTYPPAWPTHDPDKAENYDLASAIRIRAGAHSFEAKAFNVVASGFMDRAMQAQLAELGPDAARILAGSPRGISCVVAPNGKVVSPEAQNEETILYHDIDLAACIAPKQFHDLAGGYNRFDIFDLRVNRESQRPVKFSPEGMGP